MLGSALKGISGKGAPYVLGFGTPRQIGQAFLTTYLFPFEIASILLLVAAVGAIVLARRRRGLEAPAEDTGPPATFARPLWTGTQAESTGVHSATGEQRDTVAMPAGTHPGEGQGGW
jgi:hypothetical protein